VDSQIVKVVVFVPTKNADDVREAIGQAGGGKIGNYSHCSFSIKGHGRFRPLEGSNPHTGQVGKIETVEEERVEFVCEKDKIHTVIEAIKKVHPYEEVPVDVYPMELYCSL
jgi:hypothetical protein